MNKVTTILFLVSSIVFSQHWVHDFETSGGYTTSIAEFTDGSEDYFLRTDGSDISNSVELNDVEGSYYFAAQDIDGLGAALPVSMLFDNIDISGQSGLEFGILLAEDDDGTSEDWDDGDYIHITYNIDGAGWQNLLWIENDGTGSNTPPYIDNDFDGTGDGKVITNTFTEFIVSISGLGNSVDIRIEFDLNSGDEDIAIDYLRIGSDSNPLPVELTLFTATAISDGVELIWETATEVNNFGFDIERLYQVASSENQEWTKIGFVRGHGNSNSPKYYSFSDNSLVEEGDYGYRLKQVDLDGTYEYSDAINVSFTKPLEFELGQNYPNPFNPTTTISFSLPEDRQVKVEIFNLLGQVVETLVDEKLDAGKYSFVFDASKLGSGNYIYRVTTGNNVEIRKMMLLK